MTDIKSTEERVAACTKAVYDATKATSDIARTIGSAVTKLHHVRRDLERAGLGERSAFIDMIDHDIARAEAAWAAFTPSMAKTPAGETGKTYVDWIAEPAKMADKKSGSHFFVANLSDKPVFIHPDLLDPMKSGSIFEAISVIEELSQMLGDNSNVAAIRISGFQGFANLTKRMRDVLANFGRKP